MPEDYVKEIKERLAAATPGPYHIGWISHDEPMEANIESLDNVLVAIAYGRNNEGLLCNAPIDIANLLAEREILRNALSRVVENENLISGFVVDALAYDPTRLVSPVNE